MTTRIPLVPRILLRMCVCTLAFFFMLSCTDNQPTAAPRPDAKGSPSYIAAHHNCWNDTNPHPVPGHVIVQVVKGHGSGMVAYMGRAATGQALNHIGGSFKGTAEMDGKEYRVSMTALYFCV